MHFKKFSFTNVLPFLKTIGLWALLSLLIGLIAGLAGTGFQYVLGLCKTAFFSHPWLVYLLPVGGIAIVLVYEVLVKGKVKGTDMVILGIRENKDVPILTAPLIFFSTAVTHLLGGSSGREGAALQLGGSLASFFGKLFRLDEKNRPILVMCGMAAAFSALFGTPVAAAVFVLEVTHVGMMNYRALFPCIVSSFTGCFLARLFGFEAECFSFAVPELSLPGVLQALVIACACAVLSILFIQALDGSHHFFGKYLKNPFLRVVAGGGIIILLTVLVGSNAYNGAGMDMVGKAVSGNANWYDFILKLVFTAITLGSGYKGGEIVPTFYIGATFGCVFGSLLGMDAGIASALGAVALFCGVTNCPIASILIGAELFGGEGIAFYCIVCACSYALSGRYSLYKEQRILNEKIVLG